MNALSERTLTVGDIVVSQVWAFDPTESAAAALASMTARNYDVAAVGPAPLRSYVERSWLKGVTDSVNTVAREIPVSQCVDRSLPLL